MIESTRDFLKYIWGDVRRLVLLGIILIIITELDNRFQFSTRYAFLTATITSTSIVMVVAGFTHLIRRILFPSIYMGEVARAALQHPIGAAVVYLGICIVTATFVVMNIILLS